MKPFFSPGPEEQVQLLLEMSQQVSRTFDLQEILKHLLGAVARAVNYDAAGVFVLNQSVDAAGRQPDRAIAGAIVRDIVRQTHAYTGRSAYDDDFTLVVVKRDCER